MASSSAKKRALPKGQLSTKNLYDVRVVGGKSGSKRIGKVRRFVFHPSSKRCVGFMVKRPDLALMFHRRDLFIPIDGFDIEDGRVVIPYKESDMEGKGAIKRLELDWEACTMWEGMPIMAENGTVLGSVSDIIFMEHTGKVVSITAHRGNTAKVLLGQAVIPANLIRGFKLGIGTQLTAENDVNQGKDDLLIGAILVSDEVLEHGTEGGIAEKAGQQSAIAQHKAKEAAAKAKPKVDKASKQAGDAINKGAYITGKQLGAAKGMFSEFKKEYDKALGDEQ